MDKNQIPVMPLRPLNGNDARTILLIAADWLEGGSGVDVAGMNKSLADHGYTPYIEMFRALQRP